MLIAELDLERGAREGSRISLEGAGVVVSAVRRHSRA